MWANDQGRTRQERDALIRQGQAEAWRHEEYGYHEDEPPDGYDPDEWLVEIAPEAPPREEPDPNPAGLIRQLFVTWNQGGQGRPDEDAERFPF